MMLIDLAAVPKPETGVFGRAQGKPSRLQNQHKRVN